MSCSQRITQTASTSGVAAAVAGGASASGQTAGQGPPCQQSAVQRAEHFWLDSVRDWYPHRHTRTYFLPPLHFRKIFYAVEDVAGLPVLVPQPAPHSRSTHPAPLYPAQPLQVEGPQQQLTAHVWSPFPDTPSLLPQYQDSDARDDSAMERVLRCLRVLGRHQQEPMMVLSELKFQQYLDGEMDPLHKAACSLLPRPSDLPRRDRIGDFDVLALHRQYGMIVGEVKCVGANQSSFPLVDRVVVDRVKKAVGQLDKAERNLRRLSSDLAPVRVTKTLLLPNVQSEQVLQALSSNARVSQELMRCVGGQDLQDAVSRCLCGDFLPTTPCLDTMDSWWGLQLLAGQCRIPWLYSRAAGGLSQWWMPTLVRGVLMGRLALWWQRNVVRAGPDCHMTDDVYDRLLARFCGPATTVDIATYTTPRVHVPFRTQGQAVAETGWRMSQLALYPDQVRVLNDRLPPCVFLHAPPGCGKTVMLVLKAIQWLRAGHNVQVVSVCDAGRAVSALIEAQIAHTLETDAAPVGALTRHQFDFEEYGGVGVQRAIRALTAAQSNEALLHVIVDEVIADDVGSEFIQFITALHDQVPALHLWAAGVVRLDRRGSSVHLPPWLYVQTFSTPLRFPPSVLREVQQARGIDGKDCLHYATPACPAPTDGPAVIWLKHRGQPGHYTGQEDFLLNCEECGRCLGRLLRDDLGVGHGPDLLWRDVFILVNTRIVPTCGLVRGLEKCDVPVMAVWSNTCTGAQFRDVALGITDAVALADWCVVSGLERKIVIGIGGYHGADRLLNMSRCTSQLVFIDKPAYDEPQEEKLD